MMSDFSLRGFVLQSFPYPAIDVMVLSERKNFYPQQRSSFVCKKCHKRNDDHFPSPRNHCKYCLYSLHVDQRIPGDRLSTCKGLMPPIRVEYSAKKGYSIIHHCNICHHENKNKTIPDDNFELITLLSIQHA